MFLRHRLIRPNDLETCFSFTRDRHLYASEEVPGVLSFWRELIQGENSSHSLLEETRTDGSKRILYFCLCAPLHDAFLEEAYAGRQPAGLARQVFLAWREGRSPIRTIPEIAAANAGAGTPVFVMHTGFPDGLDHATELMPMLDKVIHWIPQRHSGYQCREMVIESYTDWQVHWSDTASLCLRIDYAKAGWPVPDGWRDCVHALNPAEAEERIATPYAPAFRYSKPRFCFTEGERLLLLHALSEETDADIADLLCVSPETVKKRWANILAKVQEFAPELIPGGNALSDSGKGRGPEKRGRVLSYLTQHMEELRPYGAARM